VSNLRGSVQCVMQLTRGKLFPKVAAAIALSASILLLGYGLYDNWSELSTYEWHINYSYLAVLVFMYPVSLIVLIMVWHSIMGRMGVTLSLSQDLQMYCYSNLARRLPGAALWHVGGRVYLYGREGVSRSISALGTFLELALHSLAGVLVFLALRPFYPHHDILRNDLFLVLIIPVTIVVADPTLLNAKVAWLLRRFSSSETASIALTRRGLLTWIALYSFSWVCAGFVLYLLVEAVYPASTVNFATITGIGAGVGALSSVASFVPIGLGREITISLLLSRHIPLSVAIVVSLLFRLLSILAEMFWAFVFLLVSTYVPKVLAAYRLRRKLR
jgi:uncharacterized membrane protein YbhN (UPF0104 family)